METKMSKSKALTPDKGDEVHKPIGIDPASGKASCIWRNDAYEYVTPQKMRSKLEGILNHNNDKYVVAWDAPISFDESSYSDRLIDKVTREWVKAKIEQGVFEKKSINALPFSGLSHWVITCKALGYPFGEPLTFSELSTKRKYINSSKHHLIVEVHPAVSMGAMWVDKQLNIPFPVYKKSTEARKVIVENLEFPDICTESDDILDAYVAHLMAKQFISGNAEYLNNPMMGSYVLPLGRSFEELLKLASSMS